MRCHCGYDHNLTATFPWERHLMHRLDEIERKLDTVSENQSHLNTSVQAIADSLTAIEQEIADLKAQPGAEALDFSRLDALVTRAQGDVPPSGPPAVTAPPTP